MELWKELHERAASYKGTDDLVFISMFARKIPRFGRGCACNEHFQVYRKNFPPPFGEPFGVESQYFIWTYNLHESVNQRLCKPSFTLEQIQEMYKYAENLEING